MCRNGRAGNLRRSASSWGLVGRGPGWGRYLSHTKPAHSHGSCSTAQPRPYPSSRSCPGQHSELGPVRRAAITDSRLAGGERPMFEFRDLFQWDRFITPTIIKTFYWLVIALIGLFGISGIFSSLPAMAISPFGGFLLLLSSLAGVLVGLILSRIPS